MPDYFKGDPTGLPLYCDVRKEKMPEEQNEKWQMRSARVDKPSEIQKLLREGFEPFWGIQTKVKISDHETQPVIRMYFRKAPVFIVDQERVEAPQASIDLAPVAEWSNQFRYVLSSMLNNWTTTFMQELESALANINIKVSIPPIEAPGAAYVRQPIKFEDLEDELYPQPKDDNEKQIEHDNDGQPAGDSYRVVDDVPPVVISTVELTDAQEKTINSLKAEGNITRLPGANADGSVKLMIGADIYTVTTDGNFTKENTGAGINSQIIG